MDVGPLAVTVEDHDDLRGLVGAGGVRRAACGVRRAACGVRRAACGVMMAVRRYGAEVLDGTIVDVTRDGGDTFRLGLTGGHTLVSRRALAATGLIDEFPDCSPRCCSASSASG